eukprot:Colp12_sorted_trinity150504_noHs@14967
MAGVGALGQLLRTSLRISPHIRTAALKTTNTRPLFANINNARSATIIAQQPRRFYATEGEDKDEEKTAKEVERADVGEVDVDDNDRNKRRDDNPYNNKVDLSKIDFGEEIYDSPEFRGILKKPKITAEEAGRDFYWQNFEVDTEKSGWDVDFEDDYFEENRENFGPQIYWRATEIAKDNLFALHKSDPDKWNVIALAEKFCWTEERVKAVLILKYREEEQREIGLIPKEPYDWQKEIVALVGNNGEGYGPFGAPEPDAVMRGMKPAMKALRDEEMVKHIVHVERLEKRVAEKKMKRLEWKRPVELDLKVLDESAVGKVRHTRVFTDSSDGRKDWDGKVTVRQRNGVLRTARRQERQLMNHVRWQKKTRRLDLLDF